MQEAADDVVAVDIAKSCTSCTEPLVKTCWDLHTRQMKASFHREC